MLSWFYSYNYENKFPLKKRSVKKFGWIPDIPDNRDNYAFWPYNFKVLESVDLRTTGFLPEIYDQGELGSCTANALAAAFSYDQVKQKLEKFEPSRLFIYYNEREIEGNVNTDSGASIRDGIKVLNKIGVCPEYDYPYDINKFTYKPSTTAYDHAEKHTLLEYRRLSINISDIKKALSGKHPVIFGFTVYESFMSKDVEETGEAKIPEIGEKIIGGHAALIVGYEKGNFIVRNSWGKSWGKEGYFTMPTSFFCDKYCSDMWVIQSITGKEPEYPFKYPNFF
jgi:C1A family cysteine protease